MRPEVYVAIEGLAALEGIGKIGDDVTKALTMTLNRAADRFRTRADKAIRSEVNFPASYLRPSTGRLKVSKYSTAKALEAIVSGRVEATSLARFSTSRSLTPGKKPRGGKIAVRVKKKGPAKKIPRAFLIRLNNDNIGLAVRQKDGTKPPGAYKPKHIGNNVYLLYGPSVDQALVAATSGDGVARRLSPEIEEFIATEFPRQLARLGVK